MEFRVEIRPNRIGGGTHAFAWIYYLVVAGALAVAYFLLPTVPAKLIVWPALGWSSVAAIAVGVRLHRPQGRAAVSYHRTTSSRSPRARGS